MMESLHELIPYVIAIGVALTASLAAVAALGAALGNIKYFVYVYLAIILLFPNVSWGVLEPETAFNIYSRGTGYFYFSLVTLALYGTFVAALFVGAYRQAPSAPCNLLKYIWAFFALLLGHVIVAAEQEVPLLQAISGRGVINVLNMGLLIAIMIRVFVEKRDVDELAHFLVACALVRGLWGIFRFLFLGGDPANAYANFERIDVTLTFFDINDSVIACTAGFYSAWRLAHAGRELTTPAKLLYAVSVVVSLLVIIFSYRRTAWGGLILAGSFFLLMLPRRVRPAAFIASIAVTVPVLTLLIAQRAGRTRGRTFLEQLLPDVYGSSGVNLTTGRFVELTTAFETIKDHLLFGVGAWGSFRGEHIPELAFHQGMFDYVHSGLVHIWLKTGLVGLAILLALFVAYLRYVHSARPKLVHAKRALFEAGFAGFLFSVPNLLLGTPIVEYRTMQVLGLLLALPYLVHAAHALPVPATPLSARFGFRSPA